MKKNAGVIKLVVLLGIIVFLFGFSNKRNSNREIRNIHIEFIDSNNPFITHETINNILIQNIDSLTRLTIKNINLMSMEKRLNDNSMIRNAEVFVTIDGILGTQIEQRQPIGRVRGNRKDFYIDADGKSMPLSEVYSARVPIVSGVSEEDISTVTPVLLELKNDEFMRKIVVGITKNEQGELEFELRNMDLKTVFGKANAIENKFQKFKAFYKKTKNDSTIYKYKKIDLQFGSQVIATKN